MGEIESGFKTIEFTLPSKLVEQMKKLSKIKGHSVNDEFTEAIKIHLHEENRMIESSTLINKIDASSIDEHFSNDQNLKSTLDREVTDAVKKHLKKHTHLLK